VGILVALRLFHVRLSAGPSSAQPHLCPSQCCTIPPIFLALNSHVIWPRPPRLRPRPSTSACVFRSRCADDIFPSGAQRASPGPDGLHASSHLFCTRCRCILPCCTKLHRVRRQLHKPCTADPSS
ncbi:hypothetical protein C8F01DRAFT_1152216, partial [Mycena amicta]